MLDIDSHEPGREVDGSEGGKVTIHDPAAVEIWFVEVHDTVFRGSRDFHETFLVFDLVIATEAFAAQSFGFLELRGQLLDAGFTEMGERGVVFRVVFEGFEEGVFVVRGGHVGFWSRC